MAKNATQVIKIKSKRWWLKDNEDVVRVLRQLEDDLASLTGQGGLPPRGHRLQPGLCLTTWGVSMKGMRKEMQRWSM